MKDALPSTPCIHSIFSNTIYKPRNRNPSNEGHSHREAINLRTKMSTLRHQHNDMAAQTFASQNHIALESNCITEEQEKQKGYTK